MVGDLIPLGAVIAPMALLATAIASVGVVVALTALGKTGIVHWGIIIAVVVLVLALVLGTFFHFLFVFITLGVITTLEIPSKIPIMHSKNLQLQAKLAD